MAGRISRSKRVPFAPPTCEDRSLQFAPVALAAVLVVPWTSVRAEEWTTLDDTIARVTVAESANPDGSYKYQYTVTNLDPKRHLVSIEIGFEQDSGDLELVTFPVAFLDHDDDRLAEVLSGTSPKGWSRPLIQTGEESPGHSLCWEAQKRGTGIPPGGTVTGFSVTLRARDVSHLKSHWTVRFSLGLPASSRLKQEQPPARPASPPSPDRKRQR